MSLPQPFPGLVIRYNYLWASDAAQGHDEGGKDRPAAIVMAVNRSGGDETNVYVLPITHSAPLAGTEALEIPAAVCRPAGLDASRDPGSCYLSSTNSYGLDSISGSFLAVIRARWLMVF